MWEARSKRGENLAIIGSDPAGYTAAIYARLVQLKPVIFEGAYCQARQRLLRTVMWEAGTTHKVDPEAIISLKNSPAFRQSLFRS